MRWSPAAVILLVAAPAFGHGGRYVGPVGTSDPEARAWNDWPIPDSRDYATTPAPPDSWRFAWHLAQNGLLESRRKPAGGSVAVRTMEEEVIPALRRTAADDRLYFGIEGAALLGLVRAGDRAAPFLLRRAVLAPGDRAPHRVVVESAVLGIGLAGGDDAPLLRSIAADPRARTPTRAFALLALSFAERGAPAKETLAVFEAILKQGPDGALQWHDLPAVAAFALGRLETADAAVLLARFLAAPPLPPEAAKSADPYDGGRAVRCQAAAALGRAAGAARKETVTAMALAVLDAIRAGEGGLAGQGAVIGLGYLGAENPAAATSCLERLVRVLDDPAADSMTRRFALLSIARLAARPASPAAGPAMARVRRALAEGAPTPSWAAIAAGIAGRGNPVEERFSLADGVRKLWDSAPTAVKGLTGKERGVRVEERGGCLVALGLLQDLRSRPILMSVLGNEDEVATMRGYAAEGLGLLGDAMAAPLLRKHLGPRGDRGLHRPVALALGVLGDAEAVPLLIDRLRDPKSSTSTLSACAQALGLLNDGASVAPLLEILGDPELPDLQRAFAAHALGRMAAGRWPDPFAALSEDAPFRACSDSLVEIWSLF